MELPQPYSTGAQHPREVVTEPTPGASGHTCWPAHPSRWDVRGLPGTAISEWAAAGSSK